jgi:hypothetical protein
VQNTARVQGLQVIEEVAGNIVHGLLGCLEIILFDVFLVANERVKSVEHDRVVKQGQAIMLVVIKSYHVLHSRNAVTNVENLIVSLLLQRDGGLLAHNVVSGREEAKRGEGGGGLGR